MTSKIHALLLALVAAVISTAAMAAGPRYQVEVDGLACPFCAYGIEKQLGNIQGVKNLETDIEAGRVIVTMEEGHTLDESRAELAVDRAGFTLGGFEPLDAPGTTHDQ
ncbi:heavy-metal-associated domain-containing protein [Halomonas cerina]|uniref:Mercuric ion binding protein n=1 Tax=Halomonas cerina TaxID=447424 RepID=A0A839V9Z5_9GAMM|nr:heavy-metal-associated domain-containing protein [Halomonas cerina]MBB3189524.1 mercuric ion binding protein [Halomonas cerina]